MAVSHLVGLSVRNLNEFTSSAGPVSIVTAGGRDGRNSVRFQVAGAATNAIISIRTAGGGILSFAQSFRGYIKATSGSSSGALAWIVAQVVFGSTTVALSIDNAGKLQLSPATGTPSGVITDGNWHRFDVDVVPGGSTSTVSLYVDGGFVDSGTFAVVASPQTTFTLGETTNPNTLSADYQLCDLAIYSSSLPAVLTDFAVSTLLPTSDNARGGWTTGSAGTTNLWDAVNNQPPAGTIVGSQTATSTIKNAVSSTTDNCDLNCAAYNTITGLSAASQVLAVQAICNDAQEVTTGSPKAGAVVIVSNPSGQTERGFDFGIPNGNAGSTTAAAVGAFPTGWGTHHGPVSDTPTVTVGTSPVVRVGKRVASTRVGDVDYLAIQVMWSPVAELNGPVLRLQSVTRASVF